MIQFRQKTFSEYDAMRSLYVNLCKLGDKNKWKVIDRSSLIPILKGNNVVIERFVISTSFLHRDKYRLYLKIGAKAKLPDEVRLPERVYDQRLGNASININFGAFDKRFSELENRTKLFGAPPTVEAKVSPHISFQYEVRKLLGNAIKYDKKARSLVLEFDSIKDAMEALNILPFGINYNVYLLA